MTKILSIDTTGEFGGIAALEDGELLQEVPLHAPDGFGHVLYPHLDRLLRRQGWRLGQVDCFASASGPGSFTGVRVGLAAVKGLAEATGKPVVAVSNLRALAWFGSAPLRATLIDARRGEVYGAVYDAALEVVCDETVSRFPAWLASLPGGDIEFLSAGFAPFGPALAGTKFASAKITPAPRVLAAAVGRVAFRLFAAGKAQDAAQVDANYIRRSDAERFWRDPVR